MTLAYQSTVMVTGARADLGEAIVRRYTQLGYYVVAAARRAGRVKQVTTELGPTVHPLELDVRSHQAVARAMDRLPADFSQIDILINNAGLAAGVNLSSSSRFVEHRG